MCTPITSERRSQRACALVEIIQRDGIGALPDLMRGKRQKEKRTDWRRYELANGSARLVFFDICGGPGSWSELLLQDAGDSAEGTGLSLRDGTDKTCVWSAARRNRVVS